MSEFVYDLKFNIEGGDEIKEAVAKLARLGYEITNFKKTYKSFYDETGKLLKSIPVGHFGVGGVDNQKDLNKLINNVLGGHKNLGNKKFQVKDVTDKDTLDRIAMREKLERDAAKKRYNELLAEHAEVDAMTKMKRQQEREEIAAAKAKYKQLVAEHNEAEAERKMRKQQADEEIAKNKFLYDAMQAQYKERNALEDGWWAEQDRRAKDAQRKADEEQARFNRIASQKAVKEADIADRIADAYNKASDARLAATTKSAGRQEEVNKKLEKANDFFERFSAAQNKYVEATKTGDETAMKIFSRRANRYLSESEKMINAANKLAHATEKVAKANQNAGNAANGAQKKQLDFFKTVNKMHSQLLSLNRLGHMAALAGGFYIARDAARGYVGMVRESLKYNDELEKGQATFKSLALSHIGKSGEQIKRDGVKAELEDLKKAEEVSKQLTETVRTTASYAGQDFGESLGAVKVTLGDIMSKYKGKGNMFLKEPEKVKKFSEELIELSSVMKMLDPQARKMSFHAVAIGEAFSGSQEGSKAFKANFMSLLRRENIKLTEDVMKDITNAINKGDYLGAMNAIKGGLRKAGVYDGVIEDMKIASIGANMDGVKNNLKYMFGLFNKPMALMLADWTRKLNDWTRTISEKGGVKKWLNDTGNEQARFAKRFVDAFIRIGHYFETDKGKAYFQNMKKLLSSILEIAISVVKVIGSFIGGLMGFDRDMERNKTATDNWANAFGDLKRMVDALQPVAATLGITLGEVAASLGQIVRYIKILDAFGNVKELVEAFGDKRNAEKQAAQAQADLEREALLKNVDWRTGKPLALKPATLIAAPVRTPNADQIISNVIEKVFDKFLKHAQSKSQVTIQNATIINDKPKDFVKDVQNATQSANPTVLPGGAGITP